MRIHYKIIANDYYVELCQKGLKGRKKACAFLMYAMDGELGNYMSERFCAKVWGVSPSTAHGWIKDFDKELDLFEAARVLKRNDHKSYVKNQAEQIEQSKPSKTTSSVNAVDEVWVSEAEQIEQSKSSKDILIYNINNTLRKKIAEDFFFIYRINNAKYTGERNKAIEAYMSVENATPNQLLVALHAYSKYEDKRVGAYKFISDMVYLDYMKIRMNIKIDEKFVDGLYDSYTKIFTDDRGNKYSLTSDRIIEKLSSGELEIVREVK